MASNGSAGNARRRPATRRRTGAARAQRGWSLLRAAIAVPAVMAGVFFAWRWLTPEETAMPEPRRGAAPRPKPAKPAPRAARSAAKPAKDYASLDNIALRRLPASETNNLSEAQVKYWEMFHPWPPPDPAKQPKAKTGHYRIFKSRADNEIAFVVATEPGTMVLGSRSVGPDFERRFLKSLETPIIVSHEDSEHDRELKRVVNEAKAELKAAYDRGEDIGKIMDDSREELQRLGRYKAQLEREALKMMHGKSTTAVDAEETIAAVNQMLEAKGIAPIELNSVSRLAVKYQRLLAKEQEQ